MRRGGHPRRPERPEYGDASQTDPYNEALVTDQFAAVSPLDANAPLSPHEMADLQHGELTNQNHYGLPEVHREYPAPHQQHRAPSVGGYHHPQAPPPPQAPRPMSHGGYNSEMGMEHLTPLIDESMHFDNAITPKPQLPDKTSRMPIPRGKKPQALPLPAPPSETRKYRIPQASRQSEAVIPERMTLAGSTERNRRVPGFPQPHHHQQSPQPAYPQHPPMGEPKPPKRGAPPVPPQKYDRSTAVARDPLAPLRKPLVGGRYHMVERIGSGGMGKVYKVTHSQLGKTFALKIISDNLADDDKVRELFYREARMASSLSHPNIATVVDFGEDEKLGAWMQPIFEKLGAFMVMEFLTGKPLSRILHKEKRFSIKQSSDIIRQLADALSYIHGKGIVHCDIKTENILLCDLPGSGPRRQQQVKLLDFGLAKNIKASRNSTSLAGTPHYVAPERIRGATPSPSNDIYGLGILFYELLTGKVPWDGNVDQILNGHLHKQPVAPSRLIKGGLDPAVDKLVLHALEKTPEKRHKNMAAFLYELQTVMDMLGYGRRGRRKKVGAAKKKVSRTNQRDEMARQLFDASRVPMALIQRGGHIVIANKAFAQFIMGVSVDVEGLNVTSTPLVTAWTTFDADLLRAASGTSMRRVIELEIEPGRMRRLLMWLDPGLSADQAIFGVHPLDQ